MSPRCAGTDGQTRCSRPYQFTSVPSCSYTAMQGSVTSAARVASSSFCEATTSSSSLCATASESPSVRIANIALTPSGGRSSTRTPNASPASFTPRVLGFLSARMRNSSSSDAGLPPRKYRSAPSSLPSSSAAAASSIVLCAEM